MPGEPMTARERWEAVLSRKKPDRIPMDYWSTAEASIKLMKHLRVDTIQEAYRILHIDKPVAVGPVYEGPPVRHDSDVFGCRYRDMDYGAGSYRECVFHPLAQYDTVEEIEQNYTWPQVDWYNYDSIPRQIAGYEDQPISGGGSEPFMIYKFLRGEEQGLVDLVLNPEMVHYCLDQLFGFCYENTRRIYEKVPGKVLFTYVAEDLGSENDLILSPELIREFLLPPMQKMIGLVHQAGAYAFTHSDGAIRRIIPDFLAIGTDVLNPVQWRCQGMDRKNLKRDFGDRLVFHGGVDNQYTLPFGSRQDVTQEVIDNIAILGAQGGYILAPCHNIQSIGPAENIRALYEAGYEYGRY